MGWDGMGWVLVLALALALAEFEGGGGGVGGGVGSLNKQQGWRINERGRPGGHLWLPPPLPPRVGLDLAQPSAKLRTAEPSPFTHPCHTETHTLALDFSTEVEAGRNILSRLLCIQVRNLYTGVCAPFVVRYSFTSRPDRTVRGRRRWQRPVNAHSVA